MSWPSTPVNWSAELLQMVTEMGNTNVKTLIAASDKFQAQNIEFPIKSVTCKELTKHVPDQILQRNINSVYPLLHETALQLYVQFLAHKRRLGTSAERALYEKMTVPQLVDRLLTKRAAVFLGPYDYHVLINGDSGQGQWETIGQESPAKLKLENCLSYDELKLSALLSVSSYTHFLNKGDRGNKGVYSEDRTQIQDEGIIIGLIGTRLTKPNVMEYQDVIVSEAQNVHENGYGNHFVPTIRGLFLNFYGAPCLTYKELENQFGDAQKYHQIRNGVYFNNEVFKRRIALSINTLLLEANSRAKEAGKFAYVHVVGLGLGVWRISEHQDKLFMDTVAERVQFLGDTLQNISDLQFSYINHPQMGQYKHNDFVTIKNHPLGGIRVHIGRMDPHLKLPPYQKDEQSTKIDKLLVVSYAWDSNALPGNEFWINQLHTSSDPAAACSTQVAELHNAHINPVLCAKNLRIATLKGVVKFCDYQNNLKSD